MTGVNSEPQYEWLFIFLVYNSTVYDKINIKTLPDGSQSFNEGYFPMISQSLHLKKQLVNTNIHSSIKTIIVELNFAEKDKLNYANIIISHNSSNINIDNTNKFESKKYNIKHLGSMNTVNSLSLILNHCKDLFKSKRHIISTYGHGSFLGINHNEGLGDENKNSFSHTLSYKYYKYNYLQNFKWNNFGNYATDISNNYKLFTNKDKIDKKVLEDTYLLSIKDLSESFSKVFKDKKVEILIHFNCIMHNIYNMYDLQKNVDWLIAPITGISIPGFGFDYIISKMSDFLEKNIPLLLDEKTIVEWILNSVKKTKFYDPLDKLEIKEFQNKIDSTWVIYGTQLNSNNFEILSDKICLLFSHLRNLKDTNFLEYNKIVSLFYNTISNCINYSKDTITEIKILDLSTLILFLEKNLKNNNVIQEFIKNNINVHIEAIKNEIDKITSIKFISEKFWDYNYQTTFYDELIHPNKLKGLGIIFPIEGNSKSKAIRQNLFFNKENQNLPSLAKKLEIDWFYEDLKKLEIIDLL